MHSAFHYTLEIYVSYEWMLHFSNVFWIHLKNRNGPWFETWSLDIKICRGWKMIDIVCSQPFLLFFTWAYLASV